MKTSIQPEQKPFIAILVKRAVLFFGGICLLSLFLYGIGTNQGFMERTQYMLLRITVMVGLFVGVGSLYGIIVDIWLLFYKKEQKKDRYISGMGGYLCLGGFGVAIAGLASFILVLTQGNAL
ncbi:MAG: hypothetical protein LBQ30_08070 [Treponema sp.]|jgi:FtsH-binding integral membrane protein|nr:hypothetical protein [Treponema sp.]